MLKDCDLSSDTIKVLLKTNSCAQNSLSLCPLYQTPADGYQFQQWCLQVYPPLLYTITRLNVHNIFDLHLYLITWSTLCLCVCVYARVRFKIIGTLRGT